MNLRIRTRLRTSMALLCMVLFSQWALAAHACPLYAAFGEAIAWAAADEPRAGAHTNCESEKNEASTLCVKHCAGEEQATAQPAFAAAPPAATTWWASALLPPAAPQRALRCDLAQPHAPPLNILYCVCLT